MSPRLILVAVTHLLHPHCSPLMEALDCPPWPPLHLHHPAPVVLIRSWEASTGYLALMMWPLLPHSHLRLKKSLQHSNRDSL